MTTVMGVLNVTPDSFYDGGRFIDIQKAIGRAHQMVEEGASIIDIGGESTRPGAVRISTSEEIDRVLPVLQTLVNDFKDQKIKLSIDTRNPEVMCQAVDLGANFINDINALLNNNTNNIQKILTLLKQRSIPICLMHMQGEPNTMQNKPEYTDVVTEVKNFLKSRLEFCLEQGLKREQIILDPGFGFGKTAEHNAELLKNLLIFKELGCRLLVGLSRKSCIEKWLLKATQPQERLAGSLAAAVIAVLNGADIIRTHDVKETVQSVKIAEMFKL